MDHGSSVVRSASATLRRAASATLSPTVAIAEPSAISACRACNRLLDASASPPAARWRSARSTDLRLQLCLRRWVEQLRAQFSKRAALDDVASDGQVARAYGRAAIVVEATAVAPAVDRDHRPTTPVAAKQASKEHSWAGTFAGAGAACRASALALALALAAIAQPKRSEGSRPPAPAVSRVGGRRTGACLCRGLSAIGGGSTPRGQRRARCLRAQAPYRWRRTGRSLPMPPARAGNAALVEFVSNDPCA